MFGFGEKTFLGIDIGTSAVKIVEIKLKNNKPVLSNYAMVRLDSIKQGSDGIAFDENLADYLKKIIEKGKFSKKNVYVSIPSFGGLVTLIEFPDLPKEELDQSIKFEAHKYVPMSLEDVSLSWAIVGEIATNEPTKETVPGEAPSSPSGKKLQVLLVAAPKKNIEKYQALIKNAGLSLNTIEIESFSLVRSLIGKDPGKFIIIDIGSRVCNIILVESGEIKVNRNIDAGGINITREIAQSMNINEERAEKMKISGGDLLGNQSNMTLPILGVIMNEVKRVVMAYYQNANEVHLDGIILSGGTSKIVGIDKYFSDSLGVKTVIGNPLSRVEYDPRLEAKFAEIKPQLSVCIGLVLKGVEEKLNNKKKSKNFLNINIKDLITKPVK